MGAEGGRRGPPLADPSQAFHYEDAMQAVIETSLGCPIALNVAMNPILEDQLVKALLETGRTTH